MTTSRDAGQQARHSTALRTGARVGLVAYGVVHLVIAWISLQIAWTGGGDASGSGALRTLASKPLGGTLLWISAAGLVALAAWQLLTAVWGYQTEDDDRKKVVKRVTSAGRAVVYLVLAWTAVKVVTGSGGSSGGKEEGLTAQLMSAPAGRVLVGLVGLGILAVAVSQVHRGISDNFTHDLESRATSGTSGSGVVAVGRAGYVAKGVSIGIVGALFAWSALSYDPQKAGGLDEALTTLREQPFGPYLLTLVAAGLAAFGLFCFAWARYVRTR
jgi:hypothetical protein